MDQPDKQAIPISDLINIRQAIQCFNNPSEELIKAITHLDNQIASIINSLKLRNNEQETTNNG